MPLSNSDRNNIFTFCCVKWDIMPPVRRRLNFFQLSQFERSRIVGLREFGMSFRPFDRLLHRNVFTVTRSWRAWLEERREQRARGSGRERQTTEREEQYLWPLVFGDRHISTRGVANAWYAASIPVNRDIIHIQQNKSFRCYRPHWVLPLTVNHPCQRLEWCEEWLNWDEEWNNWWVQILFGVARRPTESAMFSWSTTTAEISKRTSCSEDRGYNGLGCYQVWKAVTFAVYSRINDSSAICTTSCSSTLHSSRCNSFSNRIMTDPMSQGFL